MVIEYTATPKDVAALYSYARRHSVKLALISYGLPIGLVIFNLVPRMSPGHSLTRTDWIIALAWGLASFLVLPLVLRLRTKKDKRTLSIQPDKLSTRIGALSGDVPWAKMGELYTTDEYIFLVGKNMNGFAIPRRAFVDDAQRNAFIRLCEQYLQMARNSR